MWNINIFHWYMLFLSQLLVNKAGHLLLYDQHLCQFFYLKQIFKNQIAECASTHSSAYRSHLFMLASFLAHFQIMQFPCPLNLLRGIQQFP